LTASLVWSAGMAPVADVFAHVPLGVAPSGSTAPVYSNRPPTPDIYTLSLHDALPISAARPDPREADCLRARRLLFASPRWERLRDRKSTRLNSSHRTISYAVFCLKKKDGSLSPA